MTGITKTRIGIVSQSTTGRRRLQVTSTMPPITIEEVCWFHYSSVLTISSTTLRRTRTNAERWSFQCTDGPPGRPLNVQGPRKSRTYVDFIIHLYQPFHQLLFAGRSKNRRNKRNYVKEDRQSVFEFSMPGNDLESGVLISLSILINHFVNYSSKEAQCQWQVVRTYYISQHLLHHRHLVGWYLLSRYQHHTTLAQRRALPGIQTHKTWNVCIFLFCIEIIPNIPLQSLSESRRKTSTPSL